MKVNVDLWLRPHSTFVASAKITLLFDGNRMMTISDISVVANKTGGYFVSMPSREYKDKEGTRKFVRYIGGDEDTLLTIENAILEKYKNAVRASLAKEKAKENDNDVVETEQVVETEEVKPNVDEVPWEIDL